MESTMPESTFTTSPIDKIKANMTNLPDVSCEEMFAEVSTHPAFIFSYSLVFLVSLVLNCITMRVYFCSDQRVQSSFTVYMKNLAAADFFLCLSLPLRIANNLSNSMMIHNIYCSFGAASFYINMYSSILFMNFIAANRYLKIVRPLETHILQTVRASHHISAATWAILFAISSVYVILFIQTSWAYDQQVKEISCESLNSPQLSVVYKIIHCVSIVIFVFVLISLVILYWKTLQKVRQAQMSRQTVSSSRAFNKSKRNILFVVVVFCVCFVPYHVVRLPYVFINDCKTARAFNVLKELTILISVLNVCLDPLIYFIFCEAFRAQLKKKKDLQRSSEEQTF